MCSTQLEQIPYELISYLAKSVDPNKGCILYYPENYAIFIFDGAIFFCSIYKTGFFVVISPVKLLKYVGGPYITSIYSQYELVIKFIVEIFIHICKIYPDMSGIWFCPESSGFPIFPLIH